MIKKQVIRTRFAPSPTGNLHIGGVRTALFNYLLAKSKKGKFIVRTEDTDFLRSDDRYSSEQNSDLKWLGLVPDESAFFDNKFGPYKQSQRTEIYSKFLNRLIANKQAYYCFCTKEQIEKERSDYVQKEQRANYHYSRKCLNLSEEDTKSFLQEKKDYVIRFLIDNRRNYTFEDGIRGQVSFAGNDIEDFIICRANGVPLLNFAVVIDDHLMMITDVLRAEEHIPNTAKQLAIYESFGWTPPSFFHLSIIFNQEKKKISKRDKENKFQTVKSLRQLGYLPESILNYLVFLGWSVDSKNEFFTLKELVKIFETSTFNSRPPIFSVEKLNWFNNHWIRTISNRRFNENAWKFLQKEFHIAGNLRKRSVKIANLFREQMSSFSELSKLARFFFHYDQQVNFNIPEYLQPLIKETCDSLLALAKWNSKTISGLLNSILTIHKKIGKKELFLNLRKIITGLERGPELSQIFALLGKREFKRRVGKYNSLA